MPLRRLALCEIADLFLWSKNWTIGLLLLLPGISFSVHSTNSNSTAVTAAPLLTPSSPFPPIRPRPLQVSPLFHLWPSCFFWIDNLDILTCLWWLPHIHISVRFQPAWQCSTERGRVAKNCTQERVLLLKNNMTQVKVKSGHPKNYLSKSEKVFSDKTTQVPSHYWVTSDLLF